MRRNALFTQLDLRESSSEWAVLHRTQSHAGASVHADMEAIFGPALNDAVLHPSVSGTERPSGSVQAIGGGKAKLGRPARSGAIAIAGAALLALAFIMTSAPPDPPSPTRDAQKEVAKGDRRNPAPEPLSIASEADLVGGRSDEAPVLIEPAELAAMVPAGESSPAEGPSNREEAAPIAISATGNQTAPSTTAVSTPPTAAAAPPVAAALPPVAGNPASAADVPSFASAVLALNGQGSKAAPIAREERRQSQGRPVTGAQLIQGRIRNSDYPRAARRARAQGTVYVRFAVQPDGNVGDCAITRSSGSAVLDATTCELIRSRFRYTPARDVEGRAVPDVIVGRQAWWLGRRGRPPELLELDRSAARSD